MKGWMPSLPEVLREALIVCAGALLAAAVVRSMPPEWRNKFTLPGSSQE